MRVLVVETGRAAVCVAIPLIVLCCLVVVSCGCPQHAREEASVSAEVAARAGAAGTDGPGLSTLDGITEDEAVRLALWNNTGFKESLADLGISRADLVRANMIQNPVLSLLFPWGPKQLEAAVTLPLEALWLRRPRLKVATTSAEATAERLVATGLDVVRDVRVAYADLRLARTRSKLHQRGLELRKAAADLARARVRGGDVPRTFALDAEVEVARTEDFLNQAESSERIAAERLRGLVGLTFSAEVPTFVDDLEEPLAISVDARELEAAALSSRPEVRAAELEVEAAGARAGLARAECFTLSAILDSNGSGDQGFEAGPGIVAALPIFNQNDGATAEACARLEKAARHYLAARDAVALEVREALERYVASLRAFRAWQTSAVEVLGEAARAADAAFRAGESTRGSVIDVELRLNDARNREAELRAEAFRSEARLERALGRRMTSVEERTSRPSSRRSDG